MGEPNRKAGKGMTVEHHMEHQHVYLDLETGQWGDRSSLILLSLTRDQVERLDALEPGDRVKEWEGATRYFGDVAELRGRPGERRHLTIADRPEKGDA